eukprot:COSAG02_NODE_67879_length_252_cov_0.549020_1_plen_22_part_10
MYALSAVPFSHLRLTDTRERDW